MKKFLCLAAFIGLTLTGCPDNSGTNNNPPPGTDTTNPTTAPSTDTGGGSGSGSTSGGGSKASDTSHIKVGQKYTYEMNTGGMKMMQVWEVKEITPNAVKVAMTNMMDTGSGMNPVGDPTPFDYPLVTGTETATTTATTTAAAPTYTFEEIEAAGKKWRCMVVTTGNMKSYTFAPNDIPTFPGAIKTETDGNVTQILTKVE